MGRGPDPVAGQMPFTPRVRNVLQRANHARLSLGSQAVAPEHLSLAMVGEKNGVASQVLTHFGVHTDALREDLVRVIQGASTDA